MNNSSWVQIHPMEATQMTTADLDGNGRADLLLNFPGYGIWVLMNNSNWVQLNQLNAEAIVAGHVDVK